MLLQSEPVLRKADLEAWEVWSKAWLVWSRTLRHKRQIDKARRVIDDLLKVAPDSALSWSGGKDSTALCHLLRVTHGVKLKTYCHKDSWDFPGSEAYVQRLAAEWDVDLELIRPPIDPDDWLKQKGGQAFLQDLHSRQSEIAKITWWNFVDTAMNSRHAGRITGVRAGESRGRRKNRQIRGLLYQLKPRADLPLGQWCAQPIADWDHMDVYAYCLSHGVELHPLYKCIALMHRNEPWWLRDEWWVPDSKVGAQGGVAWIRHYWPSLYMRLLGMFREVGRMK